MAFSECPKLTIVVKPLYLCVHWCLIPECILTFYTLVGRQNIKQLNLMKCNFSLKTCLSILSLYSGCA